MSRIIKWPPVPGEAPPQTQYEIGTFQGWSCCCSHLEPGPNGPSPHFVVDWNKQVSSDEPYPFLPSAVPQFLQDVWMVNAKKNRPYVKHTIAELKDKHWGLPIYVVGTGPSLYKNMDQLRNVKDGIIIATNNAINILPKDIKIDYYCVVDGRLPKRWWENLPEHRKNVKVISVPLVTHDLVDKFDDENIYWTRFAGSTGPNQCFDEYPELPCLEPGYVVGFTATNAAFYMGGNPIVLVGMDCCLTNGYLHSGDTAKAHILPGEAYQVVTDIYDAPQVTSSTYQRGMWKLSASAKLNGGSAWFINATEGGCLKDFVSIIPLHEVVSWENDGENKFAGHRTRKDTDTTADNGDGKLVKAVQKSSAVLESVHCT